MALLEDFPEDLHIADNHYSQTFLTGSLEDVSSELFRIYVASCEM